MGRGCLQKDRVQEFEKVGGIIADRDHTSVYTVNDMGSFDSWSQLRFGLDPSSGLYNVQEFAQLFFFAMPSSQSIMSTEFQGFYNLLLPENVDSRILTCQRGMPGPDRSCHQLRFCIAQCAQGIHCSYFQINITAKFIRNS